MTVQISNDVRIKREPRQSRKRYVHEFWTVQVYDFGYGWRDSGRYESQHQAELAARYYMNQG